MKYAVTRCLTLLALVALIALGGCAFDQGGYDGDEQNDPGSDMGQPDPTSVDPGAPEDPDPGAQCTDTDDDGFFSGSSCEGPTDCDDDDDDVRPTQEAFFEDDSNGSYDYDCDGVELRELDVKADTRRCISGWKKEPPRCGDEKEYLTCEEDRRECDCESSMVVQRCR